ncbi:MAG: glycosyltransferase [Fervidicoccaceae archaeon]
MEDSAIVAHHFWSEPGGAELTMASAAQALRELGIHTSILSPTELDKEKYRKFYGISLDGIPIIGPRLKMKRFALFSRLLLLPMTSRHSGEEDLVLIDSPFYKRRQNNIIEYIHFPLELYFHRNGSLEDLWKDDPYIAEKYSKVPLNIYWKMFTKLSSKFSRKNPFESASAVLVNSAWTGNIVRELYGEKPKILNPPLPPSTEILEKPRPFEERDVAIVMLGRFSEEKRYHWVIEKIIPKVLKENPEVKLYIIGSASSPHSKRYLEALFKIAGKISLKASLHPDCSGNICFLPNASSELKREIMDRTRVFLHSTVNEHWGIAVAEAMARGLPVVMHRSGGAWSDLAEYGKRAVGYLNEEEAAEELLDLVSDGEKWRRYSGASLERATALSYNKFKGRLAEVIQEISN